MGLAIGYGTVLAIGFGCEGTTGVRLTNRSPTIRLTAGPTADSLHIHRITFHWVADDIDGHITGYEYAVNDTLAPDSLHTTTLSRVSLVFEANEPLDSVPDPDGGPEDLFRFGRTHTFHVRAIDDRGHRSPFASAAFYALTVAPMTKILVPEILLSSVNRTFEVSWSSEDLDGDLPPQAFSTRIVPVPIDSLLTVAPEKLDCDSCGPPWSEFFPGSSTLVEGIEPGAYLFGIRARDEAGAVEPQLRLGGNVVKLRVASDSNFPRTLFSGPGKTVSLPGANVEEKTFALVTGEPAALAWDVDATHYASRVVSIRYGIDLQSLEANDPGWVQAARDGLVVRFVNPPGVADVEHDFYLELTDLQSLRTVVDVVLKVGPADLALDVLYVDDTSLEAGTPVNPSDRDRDFLIRDVLLAEAARRGLQVDEYVVQDTPRGLIDGAPDLSLLRRYRLLVWNVRATPTVLARSMGENGGREIQQYLDLGGHLLLFGQRPLYNTLRVVFQGPFGFVPGEFGHDYLHIESTYDGDQVTSGEVTPSGANAADRRDHGMDGAIPTDAAAAEGWPELLVAQPPYTNPIEGMPFAEAMTKRYDHGTRAGDLDTLYTYVTNGSRLDPPRPSSFAGAPCAYRYSGPGQGKVMVFGFPILWWSESAIDSLGASALAWYFDEP